MNEEQSARRRLSQAFASQQQLPPLWDLESAVLWCKAAGRPSVRRIVTAAYFLRGVDRIEAIQRASDIVSHGYFLDQRMRMQEMEPDQ